MKLQREIVNSHATIGTLTDDAFSIRILENPWRGNGPDSSIPPGHYTCKRVDSPKFGDTFEVTDVPNRSHILFHWGNTEADTLGCLLTGLHDNGFNMVLDSRKAFAKFMEYNRNRDEFTLEINDGGNL